MTAQEKKQKNAMPADQARQLLPEAALKNAARSFPAFAGASYFYELESGWEVRILMEDEEVRKVRTAFELEEAFTDADVKTILIPADAVITRSIVMRVCQRHGLAKTVFFEVTNNEQG